MTITPEKLSQIRARVGALGGAVRSRRKKLAARKNGLLGGRPRRKGNQAAK